MTGLTLRPLRWDGDEIHPDDLAAADSVLAAYETHHLGMRDMATEELHDSLTMPWIVRDRTVLVLDGDQAVAATWVVRQPVSRTVYAEILLRPDRDERVRAEVLVDHLVASARELADGAGWTFRASSWVADEVLADVLRERGVEEVRRFYLMEIASDSPAVPREKPPLPDGVTLEVGADERQRRTIWEVETESFADHWNFTAFPFDEWWSVRGSGETHDPSGWWLLRVDGVPAAMCILDDSRASLGNGWVAVLGVRRGFRGRGLATWLLRAAFVRERDRGMASTMLAVDAENPTGAVALYESAGMHAARVARGWALPL